MLLTIEQAEALREQPETFLELVDPQNERRYVLMPREDFERLLEDAEEVRQARDLNGAARRAMCMALLESNPGEVYG
jgi:hypothetical protein